MYFKVVYGINVWVNQDGSIWQVFEGLLCARDCVRRWNWIHLNLANEQRSNAIQRFFSSKIFDLSLYIANY